MKGFFQCRKSRLGEVRCTQRAHLLLEILILRQVARLQMRRQPAARTSCDRACFSLMLLRTQSAMCTGQNSVSKNPYARHLGRVSIHPLHQIQIGVLDSVKLMEHFCKTYLSHDGLQSHDLFSKSVLSPSVRKHMTSGRLTQTEDNKCGDGQGEVWTVFKMSDTPSNTSQECSKNAWPSLPEVLFIVVVPARHPNLVRHEALRTSWPPWKSWRWCRRGTRDPLPHGLDSQNAGQDATSTRSMTIPSTPCNTELSVTNCASN